MVQALRSTDVEQTVVSNADPQGAKAWENRRRILIVDDDPETQWY